MFFPFFFLISEKTVHAGHDPSYKILHLMGICPKLKPQKGDCPCPSIPGLPTLLYGTRSPYLPEVIGLCFSDVVGIPGSSFISLNRTLQVAWSAAFPLLLTGSQPCPLCSDPVGLYPIVSMAGSRITLNPLWGNLNVILWLVPQCHVLSFFVWVYASASPAAETAPLYKN